MQTESSPPGLSGRIITGYEAEGFYPRAGVLTVYNEYFIHMLMGRIPLEAGYKEMVEKWCSNGGAELISEAQELDEQG